jgi:VanZ family protein
MIRRGRWLVVGWAMAGLVVWLSLKEPGSGPELINDKLAHGLAYCALALWFGQLYRARRSVALALITLGGLLELLQGLSGYRDMSLADLAADSLGVILGIGIAASWPGLLAALDRHLA